MGNVLSRRRRKSLRRVRGRRRERATHALDKSKRRNVFWRSQRDRGQARGDEIGDRRGALARKDERERARPEGLRETARERSEVRVLFGHREARDMADE